MYIQQIYSFTYVYVYTFTCTYANIYICIFVCSVYNRKKIWKFMYQNVVSLHCGFICAFKIFFLFFLLFNSFSFFHKRKLIAFKTNKQTSKNVSYSNRIEFKFQLYYKHAMWPGASHLTSPSLSCLAFKMEIVLNLILH